MRCFDAGRKDESQMRVWSTGTDNKFGGNVYGRK